VATPDQRTATDPLPCPRPLVVLSPPRSFTSVISTMLGQHPDTYALPETNLFSAATVREWWQLRDGMPWQGSGLLRSIAELRFAGQSESHLRQARRWLLGRADWPTGSVFRALRAWVHPKVLVEASPRTSLHAVHLARLPEWAPRAMYLHLIRHPRDQSASLLGLMTPRDASSVRPRVAALAGRSWLRHHVNILRFLESVPPQRYLRVRGEDLLGDPDTELRAVVRWLGLRADDEAIEAMKHPENSPFACVGPPSARFGNDPSFLRDPVLRRSRRASEPPLWSPCPRQASRMAALSVAFGYAATDGAQNGREAVSARMKGRIDG
jgi:Sulfotransferase family